MSKRSVVSSLLSSMVIMFRCLSPKDPSVVS